MTISLGIPANFDARGVGVDTHYKGEVKTASGIILPPPPPSGLWDVNNASYSGNSFSASTQSGYVSSAIMSKNKLKVWVLDGLSLRIFEYDLPVAGNINGALYNGVNMLVNEEVTSLGFSFNNDESLLWVIDNVVKKITEYSLPSPGTIGGGSFTGRASQPLDGLAGLTDTQGLYVLDGGLLWMVADESTNSITVFNSQDASDPTNLTVSSSTGGGGAGDIDPRGTSMKPDGSTLYVMGQSARKLLQFELAVNYDVSAKTLTGELDVLPQMNLPFDISWFPNGDGFIIPDNSSGTIFQYSVGL